ncbi:MAG: SpoIIE family protein phosphatase [Bacteroidia bacterium]|nr:SpoIIE family protein phosphatase [Bacteroidia bacterium]
MNRTVLAKLYLILCLIWVETSFGQKYNFRVYSVEHGLAQATLFDIIQDQRGYLWFATSGGVSKFDGHQFHTLSTADGLPSNRVSCLFEDADQRIFIGTDNGLAIYDPILSEKEDSTYLFYIGKKSGLSDFSISDIAKDKNGDYWIATEMGISRLTLIEGKNEVKSISNYDLDDGLINNSVTSLLVDSKNNLWVTTMEGISMSSLNSDTIDFLNYELIHPDYISRQVFDIAEDNNGNIWASSWNLYKYENGTFIDHDDMIIGKNRYYRNIYFDNDNVMWLSGQNLVSYDWKNSEMYYKSNGLIIPSLYCMLQDSEGNYWFGSAGGGVYWYSNKTFAIFSDMHGMNSKEVRAIQEDDLGYIWFATSSSVAIFPGYDNLKKFNIIREKCVKNIARPEYKPPSSSEWSLVKDDFGNMWIGTASGLVISNWVGSGPKLNMYKFGHKDGIGPQYAIMALFKDTKGAVWAGTYGTGLFQYNFKVNKEIQDQVNYLAKNKEIKFKKYTVDDGLSGDVILSVFEDNKSNLWVGTTKGLSMCKKYHEKDILDFIHFKVKDGIKDDKVLSMAQDQDGDIWMATKKGISRYTYPILKNSKGTFRNYTTKDGLLSDTPYLIHVDSKGFLWVGTNKGIEKYNVKWGNFKMIRQYGKLEGFMGIETNHGAVYEDSKGNMWFGTVNGAIKYDPVEEKINEVESRTHITGLKIFLRPAPFPVNDKFIDTQNHLTFEFVGISYTLPENVRYQYKLEGFDENWSPITTQNFATYANLSPGEYAFKVKSCNNEMVWNTQPTVYSFVITPPFWETNLFYAMCVFLLGSGIYSFIKIRETNLRRSQRILQEQVRLRTDQLYDEKEKVEQANLDIEQKNKKLWEMNLKVNKEKERIESANLELEKLSIIASKTDNAILVVDPSYELEWANEAFKKNMGYTLEEYKQHKGSNLIDTSSNPEIKQLLDTVVTKGKSITYESSDTDKDGNELWFQTTITPIIEDDKVKKLILIDSDFTERKKAEDEVTRKNIEITSSINYASNIQNAMLPPLEDIYNDLAESFVFFKPMDVVSGDFYWYHKTDDNILIAAVDCTGHGVPGAFVSMVGNQLLNSIIKENRNTQPSKVLDDLHLGIVNALRQNNVDMETRDGMDIALCKLNVETLQLEYAGANRPLVIVPNGAKELEDLDVLKANKIGIGGVVEITREYNNHEVQLKEGDTFYIFSDGYVDQFGGPKNKKYKSKNLNSFLLKINSQSMKDQGLALEKEFIQWKGDYPQIDDVLVIGVKV